LRSTQIYNKAGFASPVATGGELVGLATPNKALSPQIKI